MDWNYDGSKLVAMDRANAVRVFDPRSSSAAAVGKVEKAHVGAKPCNLCWLGESANFLTSGCSRMGAREFSIWDERNLR